MADTVVYAYAIARYSERLDRAAAATHGIAGAPVLLLQAATGATAHAEVPGLAAAISRVPAADFREDALAAHLEDIQWLEATARAHHAVIAALAEQTTVLPLRLGAVYFDDEGVRRVLAARQTEFGAGLDRLAARVEWGVKIYLEAAPAREPVPDRPPSSDLGPGRAYLHSRRAARDRHAERYRAAEQAAVRVETAAAGLAVARAHHRVHGDGTGAGEGENVVNDAYLVPEDRAEAFRAQVLRAAQGLSGIRVEVTGPWAPYSFADLPPDDRTDGR
ncbi:GvpL/GvpF family gas vesicle protein [Kitasatospora sp. MBT63]|uniref:GvpL/GvpF family gas vesicle protein n=1 Tax=Kitasatospora sp. MBT63 TaxID=1444768 RepID=UPI00053A8FAA|nr:GvpL/GvpF family gas vesicle protein [Kitasatospora sp. MBT63]